MKNKSIWYALFALITFIGTISMIDARRGGGWGRGGGWSGRRGGYGWNRGWSGRRGWGWGRPYVGLGLGSYYSNPYYYSPYYYGSPGVGFAIGF